MKQSLTILLILFSANLSAQNVGIGETLPNNGKLTVKATDSAVLLLHNSTGTGTDVKTGLYFKTGTSYSGSLASIGAGFTHRLGLFTFGGSFPSSLVERLTVLDGGNVGIGTIAPTTKLEINGQIKITGGSPGVGQLLESDATGLATWVDKSASFLPTGSSGYTLRNNGTSWIATNNLFNNGTNIGLQGNTTPASPLSFSSTGGDKINLYQESPNQIYGLGITSGTLQIYTPNTGARNIAFGAGSSSNFAQSAVLTNAGSFAIQGADAGYIFKDRTDNTYGGWNWYASGGKASLYRYTSGGNLLSIDAGGNMNLGAVRNAVGYKLSVGGKVMAEEMRVNLQADWPDYVFAPNYALKPLPELENFIKANNHLPNIPAAAEMQKSGIAIGEMQTKMMEKIEELSLYIIQQNKTIEELKQQMKALQSKTGK
jgi:hypothetical protein